MLGSRGRDAYPESQPIFLYKVAKYEMASYVLGQGPVCTYIAFA